MNLNNFTEEKDRKAKIIEEMLVEVGMTRQELIDLLVSVKKEQEQEQGISSGIENSLSGFPEAEIAQMLQGNVSGEFQKYLSFEELKKLEAKVGFAFHFKRAIDLGLKIDTAKVSEMLGLPGAKIAIKSGAKIEVNGVEKVVEANKATASAEYLQGLAGQQRQQGQDRSQSKNVSSPQSQTFLSRLVGSIAQQTQSALNSVMSVASGQSQGQDANANANRLQGQVRVVETANRQLRRQQERARGKIGDISRVSRRGGETFVTTRVRTKEGKVEYKEVNAKDIAKGRNLPQGEVDKLIEGVEKTEKGQDAAIQAMNQKMPENTKVLGISYDDKGKMQYEVLIKGERKTIPAESLVVEIKKESYAAGEGKNKGYEVSSELKIYEQVGSFKEKSGNEKSEKREKNEDLKTDLHKLDAMADRQKHLEEQKKEQKEGIKNELGSDRPEATKKASDVADQEKDPSLKYAIKQMAKPLDFDPKEKVEVKESIKTDDTLKKLDALGDRQKLMESLKEVAGTMKTAVHDQMAEAMKNKDLLKDMEKERLKNPEIGPKK